MNLIINYLNNKKLSNENALVQLYKDLIEYEYDFNELILNILFDIQTLDTDALVHILNVLSSKKQQININAYNTLIYYIGNEFIKRLGIEEGLKLMKVEL